jgi:hypothetical protein
MTLKGLYHKDTGRCYSIYLTSTKSVLIIDKQYKIGLKCNGAFGNNNLPADVHEIKPFVDKILSCLLAEFFAKLFNTGTFIEWMFGSFKNSQGIL